jgi:hypothetical protein
MRRCRSTPSRLKNHTIPSLEKPHASGDGVQNTSRHATYFPRPAVAVVASGRALFSSTTSKKVHYMLLDGLRAFVRENVPSHLQGLWTPDIEVQLYFDDDKPFRIPKDGNGQPHFSDHDYHPPFDRLTAFGATGWDWQNQRTLYVCFDLDGLNHALGFTAAALLELVERLKLIAQVEIIRSKSGQGYHVRIYFDPDSAPVARTRKAHIDHGQHALRWLCDQIGEVMADMTDACGVVAWLYHRERGPGGFELVKESTAFMPVDWDADCQPQPTKADTPSAEPVPISSTHQKVIDAVTQRGFGEWDAEAMRLNTHTHHLLTLVEDSSLKIRGDFATIATGKDGPSDRNCFCYPSHNGSWRVYRHNQGAKEHSSWWTSEGGWTTTFFNKKNSSRADDPAILGALAGEDELFHDPSGRAYVTTTIRGIRETLLLSDGRYKAKLRLAFTARTGKLLYPDTLNLVLSQLEAVALLERPEYHASIRVAEHDGRVYVDLADRERQIVEISKDGWRVVQDAPVRFVRPFGLLPLPLPERGGTLDELRRFVNVPDDEIPLLLAFAVACFHPTGPYALLQIVGEQGSAKSSLMRLIHDFTDPQLATGNTLPRDERDLLVSAQQRWLLSFDNVDDLNRKLSSLLCMVVTGAASANRKLFTDADQVILRAKRPVVITSIGNVVTASDLLDRTLTLTLPPIPPENRKSEFAIAQELRRDGVRGRIFGYILDGVSAALAGHASIERDDMPRLADLFSWATAAEAGLGVPTGSAIAAFRQQQAEESALATESEFAKSVIRLCKTGWSGTANDLADAVSSELGAQQISNSLREIAPDLRRAGHTIDFVKSNGKKLIRLGRTAA